MQDEARLDAVVTVADAKWLADRLRDAPEAKNQIAFADVIILNKTDLVTPGRTARSRGAHPRHQPLREAAQDDELRRPDRRRARAATPSISTASSTSSREFLEVDDHDHDHDHDHGHDHHHHDHGLKHYHDEHMQSVAMRLDGDVDPNKFMPWINRLTQEQGPNILRCKGIVALKDEPKRFVFQGVHMMLDGEPQREWKPGEKRESKVVFIGHDLKDRRNPRGLSRLRGVSIERSRRPIGSPLLPHGEKRS